MALHFNTSFHTQRCWVFFLQSATPYQHFRRLENSVGIQNMFLMSFIYNYYLSICLENKDKKKRSFIPSATVLVKEAMYYVCTAYIMHNTIHNTWRPKAGNQCCVEPWLKQPQFYKSGKNMDLPFEELLPVRRPLCSSTRTSLVVQCYTPAL